MGNGAKPEDFDVIKYGHDRAHELELNKFTHALEVEQLKLLILLNGGGAAALLTFAERSAYSMTREGLLYPVLFWLGGLFAAAVATIIVRHRQAGYGKAYRHRRHAAEWREFEKKSDADKAKSVNPLDRPDSKLLARLRPKVTINAADNSEAGESGDRLYDKVATLLRRDADWWANWVLSLSLVSIALFLAGAVQAALVAVGAR